MYLITIKYFMNCSEIKLLAFFYSEVCLNGVGLKESYEFSFQCGFLCSPLMKNEPIRDHMLNHEHCSLNYITKKNTFRPTILRTAK